VTEVDSLMPPHTSMRHIQLVQQQKGMRRVGKDPNVPSQYATGKRGGTLNDQNHDPKRFFSRIYRRYAVPANGTCGL